MDMDGSDKALSNVSLVIIDGMCQKLGNFEPFLGWGKLGHFSIFLPNFPHPISLINNSANFRPILIFLS